MNRPVIDASALLAFLFNETGAGTVERYLAEGVLISAVNLCEVWSKLEDKGVSVDEARERFLVLGLFHALEVVGFDEETAMEAARLQPEARKRGLSLGDKACLALAKREGAVAVTADIGWRGIAGTRIELIR